MNRVVDSNKLERAQISGMDEPSVRWAGAFATYGEHGANQSSTIVYEIEPGGRLGWHTDATEETQYIIAGNGELRMEDGTYPVAPGNVFVLPTGVRHDPPTPARKRCGRWPSSPRRCLPSASIT